MTEIKDINDNSEHIVKEVKEGTYKKTIKLHKVVENLGLEVMIESTDYKDIVLENADVNRPGLQLTGYMDDFPYERLQVIGTVEYKYLTSLDSKMQYERFRGILSYDIPAVIFSYNREIHEDIIDLARYYDVSLLRSPAKTTKLISDISDQLEYQLAPSTNLHGELLEVFGVGVLIMGKSSVGKSEAALELVNRGHRLVADDMVDITAIDKKIIGSSPDNIRHFMELRGLGIINVRRLYGSGAIKKESQVDMVIELEQWKDDFEYDRLGIDQHYIEVLGIKLPHMVVPVRAGRNIALIIEVAAMNQREKALGYNAAKVMTDNIFHSENVTDSQEL